MAKAKRRTSSSGDETKSKILEATLDTLRVEGIVGASARAIARTGDFNQALIFYHFGSVDEAIVAAIGLLSEKRLDRYKEQLVEVETLPDLIVVAKQLYESDKDSGEITVLAQAFAGASRDDEMGPALYNYIDDWTDLIEVVIDRTIASSALADHPMAGSLPKREMALAISALFLGIELMSDLDPERFNTDRLFASITAMAQMADAMMRSTLATPAPV